MWRQTSKVALYLHLLIRAYQDHIARAQPRPRPSPTRSEQAQRSARHTTGRIPANRVAISGVRIDRSTTLA
jgi:hypothetical protein